MRTIDRAYGDISMSNDLAIPCSKRRVLAPLCSPAARAALPHFRGLPDDALRCAIHMSASRSPPPGIMQVRLKAGHPAVGTGRILRHVALRRHSRSGPNRTWKRRPFDRGRCPGAVAGTFRKLLPASLLCSGDMGTMAQVIGGHRTARSDPPDSTPCRPQGQ